ncbi:MAG TPA: isoprenylcysteine carboxylmethyltransferase family protein [Gemmatimonadaceae bacterium]|nr:isoprenylcysteine carboxylmethyltransferase family protein [Gemmatimonadaceae bacterium]
MFRVLLRVIADAAVVAAALFVAAGTIAWPRAWILLGVLLIVRLSSAVAVFRVNPDLLRERATGLIHRHQPSSDRLLLLAFMGAAFVGVPAVAALDVFRWHALPSPALIVACLGLALFAVGWILIGVALRTNPFAVAVVRHQDERQHVVVDAGIYGVVRHPMYAGNPLVNVGLSLWLGSYTAALFAIIPLALLVIRIGFEERFLRDELPGYGEYAARVRYRLVPGVW